MYPAPQADLRRISSLFLCELFYGNTGTKEGAMKLLGINPCWGRVLG